MLTFYINFAVSNKRSERDKEQRFQIFGTYKFLLYMNVEVSNKRSERDKEEKYHIYLSNVKIWMIKNIFPNLMINERYANFTNDSKYRSTQQYYQQDIYMLFTCSEIFC